MEIGYEPPLVVKKFGQIFGSHIISWLHLRFGGQNSQIYLHDFFVTRGEQDAEILTLLQVHNL
jgi:hypothetical protein